jgi:hypothetical protein
MTEERDESKCPTCGAELKFVKKPSHMEAANGGLAATDAPAGRWECPQACDREGGLTAPLT